MFKKMRGIISRIYSNLKKIMPLDFLKDQKEMQDLLTFFHRANQLKSVPRYGVSLWKNGDTVAEHSWRLTLMAYIIGGQFKVGVDLNKVLGIALVHDLAESLTGDIDAYETIDKKLSAEEKRTNELKAMEQITAGIFFGSTIFDLWNEYEQQKSIEAKFVKALDKIEAFLHLADKGTEDYRPKEFHSDYADDAVKAFDDATHNFPELGEMLVAVKKELKEKFEAKGVTWNEKD